MSQAGIVDFIGTHPEIPTMFVANVGVAVPIANTIELLGAAVAAHGVPLQTVASGNTVDFNIQYASDAASSIAGNAGVASFDSNFFTVDANGFVTFNGSAATESFTVDASTPPGTNPVVPNGSGNVTVTGGQVAAGTTTHVIRTNSLAANTYTIEIQRSQAVGSSTIGDNGVSHFNSTYFTVDSNGFVSLSGSTVGQTITGNVGGSLPPTLGNWNIFGTSTAAGTTPVQTSGSGSTLTVQVQKSQAIASTNATNVGLAAFDSASFTVDGNGFVQLIGGAAAIEKVNVQTGTTPIVPSAGAITINGATVAAGTNPVRSHGTNANTLAIEVQLAQAIAATDATKIGLAAFNSTQFTVDANAFVSLNGSSVGQTITGDSGGPLSPTAGNWNIIGQQAGTIPVMDTIGSVSTLKIEDRTSPSKFVVDSSTTAGLRGTYSTIQSAITDASAGDTIIIRPGTYTENITLKNGVNLSGFVYEGGAGQATQIVGKLIDNGSVVNSTLTNLFLKTNNDFILALTANFTEISLEGCVLQCTNHTGVSIGAGTTVRLFNSKGDLGTTGIAYHTGAGTIAYATSFFNNSGGSSTASDSSGGVVVTGCSFTNPFSITSTGNIIVDSSLIDCSGLNVTAITTAGSGTSTIRNSTVRAGSASAISIGSGTTFNVSIVNINSSNTNAIAGSGTLNYSGLAFTSSSTQVANTLTLSLNGATPSNATSGFVWTSTGTNTSPTWQAISGSYLTTINGDTGSATASAGVITFSAKPSAGSSTSFSASSHTVDLVLTDTNTNTILGSNAGNGSITGTNNVALGDSNLHAVTSNLYNTAVGSSSQTTNATGNRNTSLGASTLSITSGARNVALGAFAGSGYTSSETDNIVIGHGVGTTGESNTIRIGNGTGTGTGQQNKAFIAGINSVTASNPALVTIDTSTDQLGTTTFASGTFTPTLTGASTAGTTTYTNQTASYCKVGNLVTINVHIAISAATGTGNAVIGGIPYVPYSGTSGTGAVFLDASGWTWPVGRTNIAAYWNGTTCFLTCTGTAVGQSILQMTNASLELLFTMSFASF